MGNTPQLIRALVPYLGLQLSHRVCAAAQVAPQLRRRGLGCHAARLCS